MQNFRFHAYRDSEAPGVRRAALGLEPDYNDNELPAALEWASVAKWGAMYVLLPRGAGVGTPAQRQALLADITLAARQLGYRVTHARYGRGERSWRFRVERLITDALPLEQAPLLPSGQPAQARLF